MNSSGIYTTSTTDCTRRIKREIVTKEYNKKGKCISEIVEYEYEYIPTTYDYPSVTPYVTPNIYDIGNTC